MTRKSLRESTQKTRIRVSLPTGTSGSMNGSKREMEVAITKLRNQLEKKDLEVAKLTRAAESVTKDFNALKSRMKAQNVKTSGTRKATDNDDEISQLKSKILELEEVIKSKEDLVDDLHKKLLKIRKDKDSQVEVVKETVEKVINDKDTEIRKLKAIWGMKQEDTNSKISNDENQTRARFGISAENRVSKSLRDDITNVPKTEAEKKNIARALRRNIFLSSLAHAQVTELIECMQKEQLKASCNIIREGDTGTHLYVIEDGEVDVFKDKEQETLAILTPGCVFGELAILYNCKRTASVKARTDVVLWSLDRLSFQSIVQRRGKMIRKEYIKLLHTVDQLKHLSEEKIMRIADCLEEESFKAEEYIIRQGEAGDTFYIIYEGKVKVTKYEDGSKTTDEATFLNYMGRGSFFGERALLREEKRAANVIAHSDVVCLTLDRIAFSSLIGDIREVNLTASKAGKPDLKFSDIPYENPQIIEEEDDSVIDLTNREKAIIHSTSLEKIKIVKLLGKGGFGSVRLAQIAALPSKAFALKSIKKAFIVKTGQEQHVVGERNIMMSLNSPFLARLHRTYKDKFNVYILMDAYLGGDVYYHLKKHGVLSEDVARFSIACVVEALAYLHFRSIAYRDLKPENLMIDHNGYVKLVDFGFAKKVSRGNKTWTFCGTPEYFPPEILQNLGHDFTADYWSLGILTFELLTRTTPFFAPDDMTVYEKIVDGIERVRFPSSLSKTAELLIRNLCRLDPKSRLGSMSGGVNDIRKHRWFRGFYWEGLRRQLVNSPVKVNISGANDTSNFESLPNEIEIGTDEEAVDTSAWDQDF